MITVNFPPNISSLTAPGLTQYDTGQIISMTGTGITTETVQVHFEWNNNVPADVIQGTVTNGVITAEIPDSVLARGRTIKAYAYVIDGDARETQYTAVLPVVNRARPQDYISPAEPPYLTANELLDRVETAETTVTALTTELTTARNGELSLDERLDKVDLAVGDLQNRSLKSYGVRRVLNAQSPLWERLFDAAGKVANVPIDDGVAVNDFDNIYPWSHIKECKRDNGGRVHYKGDPSYDLLTDVDWLIEIPKFYIKMERTDTTFDRVMSEVQRAGFWLPQVFKRSDGSVCDKIYVGRFKTGVVDGKDVSRPYIFPENNRHLESFRSGARVKGAGWQLIDLSYKTEVLDMLYLVESATFNSQIYLGNGLTAFRYVTTDTAQLTETAVNRIVILNTAAVNYNVGESICIGTSRGAENVAFDRTVLSKAQLDATLTEIVFDGAPVNIAVGNVLWQGAQKNGQTVNLTKPNGKLSGVFGRTSHKYRGMEDIFGSVYERVDGVLINDFVAQICRKPEQYSSVLTDSYLPAGYANLQLDTQPLEMGYDSNFPEAIFPVTAGGGATTGLCDYYNQASGLRGAYYGGASYDGVGAGLFYWYLGNPPTNSNWNVGSRLLFKPTN